MDIGFRTRQAELLSVGEALFDAIFRPIRGFKRQPMIALDSQQKESSDPKHTSLVCVGSFFRTLAVNSVSDFRNLHF